ncbi:MAG: hypothetical protein Q7R96_05535 [Nanoarchaeota archaeon]|nr:hypothetical protein [Nanoarchaeota archaeon]
MSAESILINILGAVFAVVGSFVVIKTVLPKLADVLDAGVEDQTAVDGIVALLQIFTLVIAAGFVIVSLGAIHAKVGSYLNTIKPALDVINALTPYVAYLFVGVGALLVIKAWKKK